MKCFSGLFVRYCCSCCSCCFVVSIIIIINTIIVICIIHTIDAIITMITAHICRRLYTIHVSFPGTTIHMNYPSSPSSPSLLPLSTCSLVGNSSSSSSNNNTLIWVVIQSKWECSATPLIQIMITISFNRCCCCYCCFALHWFVIVVFESMVTTGTWTLIGVHYMNNLSLSIWLLRLIDWTQGLFSLSLFHFTDRHDEVTVAPVTSTHTHSFKKKKYSKKYKKNWSKHKVMKQNVMCVLVCCLLCLCLSCSHVIGFSLVDHNQTLEWKKLFFSLDEREEHQCGGA